MRKSGGSRFSQGGEIICQVFVPAQLVVQLSLQGHQVAVGAEVVAG